jgi:ribosome biogenesis protein MAK21
VPSPDTSIVHSYTSFVYAPFNLPAFPPKSHPYPYSSPFFFLSSPPDALFRLTHAAGSIGVATQALLLLHQLMTARNSVSDRFYRALYAVLISPELPRSTKAPMFLSLLWKAVRADVSARRVAAFAKRLLQVAAEAPPNFACGCLVLVSEALKARPGLWNAVLQGEERADGGVERFVDRDGDGDGDGSAGKGQKGKKKAIAAAAAAYDSGSDEEEKEEDGGKKPAAAPAAVVAANEGAKSNEWPPPGGYDARKREPQYANADKSCFWELLPLAAHAHPSVAAMARTLLAGANVTYDGDPLKDLTMHAFLDKFVQKKAKVAVKGDSLMQPLRPGAGGDAIAAAVGAALSELDARDVAPDDAFFQKFYAVQAARGGAKKKKKVKGGDDEALVSDEEDGSGDDSDAMDDFLAGEEDGGEEGIGADPDSGYEYDQLVAAMGEDSDADDGESDEEDEEMEGSSDEEGGDSDGGAGGPFASASEEEDGGLSGAEFSDLSEGSGGSEGVDGSDLEEASSGPDDGGTSGSGSDEALDDDDDAGSLGSLSDSEEEEEGSSDEDDADADAEIAALLAAAAKQRKGTKKGAKRGREAVEDSESDSAEGLNPFELAEATDSEVEGADADGSDSGSEGEESGSEGSEEDDSDSDGDDLMLDDDLGSSDEEGGDGKGGKGGSKKDRPVFASAADFDDLIVRDLQGEADEEETAAARARAGFKGRGGGRGDAKRQRR